jgi:RimJ/RimL family protein N-acetyltransferase
LTDAHDRFWASYLGIAPSDWSEPGVSIRPHAGLDGYRGIWCFRRLARTVVSAPPGWLSFLEMRLGDVEAEALTDERFQRDLFGDAFDRLIGPTFHGALDPSGFRAVRREDVRLLDPRDTASVERFRSECAPTDWDNASFDVQTRYRAACFDGDRISAMAGYRARTQDVGDIGVLTHPHHRGEGRGAAAAGATVEAALADGNVLLFQTLASNLGAVGIAKRLGFEHYATNVAIRLRRDEP